METIRNIPIGTCFFFHFNRPVSSLLRHCLKVDHTTPKQTVHLELSDLHVTNGSSLSAIVWSTCQRMPIGSTEPNITEMAKITTSKSPNKCKKVTNK